MSEEPSKPKSVRPTAAGTGPREDVRTKGAKNGDRRAYFAQRRAGIRGRALRTVAAYHNRPVECFRCGGSKDLELEITSTMPRTPRSTDILRSGPKRR